MRILFVVADPLTPVRVRPRNFVRFLGRAGHEVVVVTPRRKTAAPVDDGSDRLDGAEVVHTPVILGRRRRAVSLTRGLLSGWPLQAWYAWHPRMARFLCDLVVKARGEGRPFDVAHVEHLRASRYAIQLERLLPVVWDSVDCITSLLEAARQTSRSVKGRLIATIDLGRTRRYEGWLVRQFDAVTVTGSRDRDALLRLAEGSLAVAGPTTHRPSLAGRRLASVTVVCNGVDLEAFAPDGPRDARTIVFSGKLSYHANVTAARVLVEEIMPLVWRQEPAARVVLAGAEPAAAVRALANRHPERVLVTGFVPDMGTVLRQATMAAVPLVYGVGVQNKVLEAMATGTPVVASRLAIEALDVQPDRDVLVADDWPSFAAALVGLLAEPERARRLGQAGRRYVEQNHRWSDAVAQLAGVYERALEAHGSRGWQTNHEAGGLPGS